MAPNPYLVLGVQVGAAQEDVKRAYRALALQCHPDKRPPEERDVAEQLFKDLRQAYDTLRDPEKRRIFDAANGRPRSCQRFPSGLAASILRRHSRRPRSACTPDSECRSTSTSTAPIVAPPAFSDHIWFARGSASVGRAYKGQEVEELAFDRQSALLAAASWLRGNPRGTCLLEVRGCSQRGEVSWRQQEPLAKARCEKTMSFLTKQFNVPADQLRSAAQIKDDFQGVELIGMRRLCVDGGFLNEGSLLLADEMTIPAITRYLLADPADNRMLFFEVVCSEGLQTLASRRKAALLAALSGPNRLKRRVSANTRCGGKEEVIFYTFECCP
ncbi:unnamed protein product [Durusdinium trenchii]|uniref:J domain-containing protein n=1 Tax=Durusdinium trenchii TaxID=1381693 RepID=A0ABP0SKA8_9DINO